jgi:hypothetical protein
VAIASVLSLPRRSENVGVRGSDHFHGAYNAGDGVGGGLPGSRGLHAGQSNVRGVERKGSGTYGS